MMPKRLKRLEVFSCATVDGDLFGFYDVEYNAHVAKKYKKGWGLIVGESEGACVHIYFETFNEMLMWVCDEYSLWGVEQ